MIVLESPMLTLILSFRSTHNMFAVALVNSDFKTAESDYRNMEDTLISAGLDILSEVGFWEGTKDGLAIQYSCKTKLF